MTLDIGNKRALTPKLDYSSSSYDKARAERDSLKYFNVITGLSCQSNWRREIGRIKKSCTRASFHAFKSICHTFRSRIYNDESWRSTITERSNMNVSHEPQRVNSIKYACFVGTGKGRTTFRHVNRSLGFLLRWSCFITRLNISLIPPFSALVIVSFSSTSSPISPAIFFPHSSSKWRATRDHRNPPQKP